MRNANATTSALYFLACVQIAIASVVPPISIEPASAPISTALGSSVVDYGPDAALRFAMSYRGKSYVPGILHCYPDAKGIPFTETLNIIPMTASLWTPEQLAADFRRRMATVSSLDQKKGIIVVLKTERCCTTGLRACTVTTAALEKRSSPLVAEFLIYGAWIKPRDHDNPAGSLKIETGVDTWKNESAGEYQFIQGPGATLVFINPANGSKIERSDALELDLCEKEFVANGGATPKLEAELQKVLMRIDLNL